MVKGRNALPVPLMGLLPVVVLILMGYLGGFTRFMADDYCSAYWAQRFGLLRSVWHWYITWSGRFSAYASDWFIVLMGARNVRFIPPIALAIWLALMVLAIDLFLRHLGADEFVSGVSLLLGVIFLFTLLLMMPSIQQSFFWWNGMRSYSLPLILLTLYAVLFQLGRARLKTGRAILLAGLFSLLYLFANAGLSDTFAVTQFSLLAILIAWRIVFTRRWDAPVTVLTAGWLGTIVALSLIIVAPGNAYREATSPPHPGPFEVLSIALQGTAGHGVSWLGILKDMVSTPANMLALTGAVLAVAWVGSLQRRFALGLRLIPAFAGLGVILSFMACLPAAWGISEPLPPRAVSVPLFALITNLFLMALIAGNWMSSKIKSRLGTVVLAVLAILTVNVSAVLNIQRLYQSRETYVIFAERWDASENQILGAKAAGQESVTVPSWPNWAGLEVLSDSSKNWLNVCTSGYYGIQVVGQAP